MRVKSGQTVLNAAMDRELRQVCGRVTLALEIADQESYPAWEAIRREVGAAPRIRYCWQDPGRWRLALHDSQDRPVRELVCDGAWVDSGEALWAAGLARHGVAPDEERFQSLFWPWQVVAEHLFPLTFGRSQAGWPAMVVELVGEEMTPDGQRLIRLEHWPAPGAALTDYPARILAFIDPQFPWGPAAGPPAADRLPRRRHSFLLTLDAFRGYMPVRWAAGGKPGPAGPSNVWEQPVDVGRDIFVPTWHRWLAGGTGEAVASSEILLADSGFNESPPADLFRIADAPGKARIAEAAV